MIVSFGRGNAELTGPLIDGFVLRQMFTAEEPHLLSVSILLSTYRAKNAGSIAVEILEVSTGRSLASDVVSAADLIDNSYHRFKLSADLLPGAKYEIRLKTAHCRSGMAPTAHHSVATKPDGYLFVFGRLMRQRELVCQFEYGEETSLNGIFPAVKLSKQDGRLANFIREREQSVTIIILNKNGYDLITKCMDRIREYASGSDIDVIIGDTGTTDERVLAFYETLPDNVRVVSGLEYHYSKANNQLAKLAETTHILFMNNDVFLNGDAIGAMMDYMRVYKVGAVGLRLLKPRGVIDHDGQVLFDFGGRIRTPDHLNINRPLELLTPEDGVTDGVTAACMLTPKSLFLDLGGFDEGYDDIYQDCDYCLRLASNGFCCVTVRRENAVHVGSATRGETVEAKTIKDRQMFHKRWGDFTIVKPKYSFVACINKPAVYTGFLETLPERLDDTTEMIPITNFDNRFTVTEALNIGRMVSLGEFLVYGHQDILLCKGWIAKVEAAISSIPDRNVGMIGFEGLKEGGTPYSCHKIGKGQSVQVQTLDELCIMTPRRDLSFDERFKFHYYGADICMQAEAAGFSNWLIGVPVEHLSGGGENIRSDVAGFKKEAKAFREKWPKDIWTTTTKFLDGKISYMILGDELNRE